MNSNASPRRARALAAAIAVVSAVSVTGLPTATAADGDPVRTNEITVVRVGAAGAEPRSAAELTTLVDRVNGTVAEYWSEQTGGAVRFSATAWPEPVATDAPCAYFPQMYAETAAAVGFTPGPGKHLLMYVTSTGVDPTWPCDYQAATTGAGPASGGRAYVRGDGTKVLVHVLGHNLGLGDAGVLRCDGYAHGRSCTEADGLDHYDVMSDPVRGTIGSLSAPSAWTVGGLSPDQVVSYDLSTGGGRVTLSPLSGRTGFRAVRITDSWGDQYWVEFRPAAGRDAWLGGSTGNEYLVQPGVLVRWRPREGAPRTWLLDGSPSDSLGWDDDTRWALPVGRDMSLDGGSFVVRVQGQTDDSSTVTVRSSYDLPFPRDLNHDRRADLMAVDAAGTLWNYRASGSGGIAGRVAVGSGWRSKDVVVSAGDVDGDVQHDVLARDRRTGDLWLYAGDGRGGLKAGRVISRGWLSVDALLSPGDWNGDGHVDLLARRRSDGVLYLYPGTGTGSFRGAVRLGGGWGVMTALAATGDLDLDGRIDFVARRRDGVLLRYTGNGRGGFAGGPRPVSGGWQQFTALTGPGDWTRDGAPDLLVRKSDGSLLLYRGTGLGTFSTPQRLGGGWGGYRLGV